MSVRCHEKHIQFFCALSLVDAINRPRMASTATPKKGSILGRFARLLPNFINNLPNLSPEKLEDIDKNQETSVFYADFAESKAELANRQRILLAKLKADAAGRILPESINQLLANTSYCLELNSQLPSLFAESGGDQVSIAVACSTHAGVYAATTSAVSASSFQALERHTHHVTRLLGSSCCRFLPHKQELHRLIVLLLHR